MTVFKGFMIIARQNLGMILLYISIFLTMSILFQKTGGAAGAEAFESERLDIAVIDRDGGILAEGLADYLSAYHNLKDVPDDPAILQDRLFYRDIYYVVTIPADFESLCLDGDEKLPVTRVPGSVSGYYVDQQINTFLNGVRVMRAGGFSLEEAVCHMVKNSVAEPEVTLLDRSGHGGTLAEHALIFRYIPYILLSILCLILGLIMVIFNEPELRRRISCSAVTDWQMNAQMVLGYAVIGLFVWIICILTPVALNGRTLLSDPNLIHYLINSLLMTLVALSLAFLVGALIKNEDLISAASNVAGLGMSFLCGVFVPLELLSAEVKNVARFLPAYWYEVNNDIIGGNAVLSGSQLNALYTGYGMQLLFAAAFLGVALVILKYRRQAVS